LIQLSIALCLRNRSKVRSPARFLACSRRRPIPTLNAQNLNGDQDLRPLSGFPKRQCLIIGSSCDKTVSDVRLPSWSHRFRVQHTQFGKTATKTFLRFPFSSRSTKPIERIQMPGRCTLETCLLHAPHARRTTCHPSGPWAERRLLCAPLGLTPPLPAEMTTGRLYSILQSLMSILASVPWLFGDEPMSYPPKKPPRRRPPLPKGWLRGGRQVGSLNPPRL
jgi:hypothetical protein